MVTAADDRLLISPAEAARLLSIGRSTVYALLADDALPGKRMIRGSVRVHLPTLREWLETGAGANVGANPGADRCSPNV